LENISQKIILIRAQLNLSQKEFAEKLNISFRNLQNYESGATSTIPHPVIASLIKVFNVNPSWLFSDKEEEQAIFVQKDLLDFLLDDFISLFGTRAETAKELEKFMIIKILDRLGSQEHGLFARILDFITLGIADAGGVRPFLFLYYIFQIISADYQNNTIENFKDYIISKINSFDTKSLIENEPLFTQKMKDKFIEFVELKLTEKECQLLVQQREIVLTQLETRMPFLTVRLHRNKFNK